MLAKDQGVWSVSSLLDLEGSLWGPRGCFDTEEWRDLALNLNSLKCRSSDLRKAVVISGPPMPHLYIWDNCTPYGLGVRTFKAKGPTQTSFCQSFMSGISTPWFTSSPNFSELACLETKPFQFIKGLQTSLWIVAQFFLKWRQRKQTSCYFNNQAQWHCKYSWKSWHWNAFKLKSFSVD